MGYYGPHGDEKLTEEAPPADDFLARACVAWEGSTAAVKDLGVRHVVLRTGLLLSMQGGALPLLVLPFRLFSGNTYGSGKQYYSWIHMQDELAAIRFLLENDKAQGVFNLTAPNPVTNQNFAHTLGQVLHRPVWLPLPRLALQLPFGDVAGVVMEGQRVLPRKLEGAEFKFTFPQLQPALEDLLK